MSPESSIVVLSGEMEATRREVDRMSHDVSLASQAVLNLKDMIENVNAYASSVNEVTNSSSRSFHVDHPSYSKILNFFCVAMILEKHGYRCPNRF